MLLWMIPLHPSSFILSLLCGTLSRTSRRLSMNRSASGLKYLSTDLWE